MLWSARNYLPTMLNGRVRKEIRKHSRISDLMKICLLSLNGATRQKTIWMKTGKKRAKKSSRAKIIAPTLQTQWFDEPELWFAENNLNVDPKIGMNLFGPRSYG